MLKVGDEVKLRKDSEYWGQSGNTIGTIEELFDHSHCYRVRWKEGKVFTIRRVDSMLYWPEGHKCNSGIYKDCARCI